MNALLPASTYKYLYIETKNRKNVGQIIQLYVFHTLAYALKLTVDEALRQKRGDFNVPIVNFPFICSNIPAAFAYEVCVSQLKRCSRACCFYSGATEPNFTMAKLKLNCRPHGLVDCCGKSVSQHTNVPRICSIYHNHDLLSGLEQ